MRPSRLNHGAGGQIYFDLLTMAVTNPPLASGAFSSLQNPQYRLLWWAGTFSFMSVQMQFLLRGILAWDLTGREGALGLVYLVMGIGMLVCTPLGGVASDRYSKRKVLLLSQGVLASGAVAMGLIVVTGNEEFWMLLVAAGVQGAGFGFFGPSRVAFTSELVGRQQLGNAISLSLLSMNGTRIFAPSLAGVLAGLHYVGIGGGYLVSGTMAVGSFLILLKLPEGVPGQSRERRNPFLDIVDGVRYVRGIPALRRLVLCSFFVIMFAFSYVVFIPALVDDLFGLSKFWVGLLSSASAYGAVAVSVPLAARANSPRAKQVMTVAGLGFGLTVLLLGLAPGFWSAFAIMILVGAASTTFQTLSNTLALGLSDDAHQGRVQSLIQLSFAGFGIAAFPLGALAEGIGLRATIVVMGAVAVAAVVVYQLAEKRDSVRNELDLAVVRNG